MRRKISYRNIGEEKKINLHTDTLNYFENLQDST